LASIKAFAKVSKTTKPNMAAALQAKTEKTEFMRQYLPCFYDMPVLSAAKILKVVESTVRSHKHTRGMTHWPFSAIRHNKFNMDWDDIDHIRADALLQTTGEDHDMLVAAAMVGASMRRIYQCAPGAGPSKKRLRDTDVKGFSDEEEEAPPPPIKVCIRDTSEFAHLDDPGFFYTLKYEDDRFITPWTEDDIREMQGLPALDPCTVRY
jgi:hypothetical protein